MSFDAQSFLDSSISGSNSTKIVPCPIGDFQGIIEKITPRQWQSKDGSTTGIALDVIWAIEDESAKAAAGRENLTVKQGIMLDTNANGGLDMAEGKNVGLGRLREAVGLNDPSQVFSFNMLPGQAAKVSVTHRVVNEDIFADVKMVAKL